MEKLKRKTSNSALPLANILWKVHGYKELGTLAKSLKIEKGLCARMEEVKEYSAGKELSVKKQLFARQMM